MINNIKISKLFNVKKGTLQSLKNVPGKYDFITASAEWKTHNEYTHDTEALVFAMGASGSLGRTHYVNGKFIASDLCYILTPIAELKNNLDLEFYSIYFNLIRENIVSQTATGTSKLAINQKKFSNFEIIFPLISDQLKIKKKIKIIQPKYLALNTNFSDNLEKLSYLRELILQDAICGKLVPQNLEDEPAQTLIKRLIETRLKNSHTGNKKLRGINDNKKYLVIKEFDIPNNWEWTVIDKIAQVSVGATPDRSNSSYWGGQNNWLSSGEVANNIIESSTEKITDDGLKHSSVKLYPKGTVLVAMIGQGKTRGQSSILNIESGTNQNVAGLIIDNQFILSKYLWYFFLSRYMKTRLPARGGNQPALNGKIIGEISIPIPPYEEQRRIVDKVDELLVICDRLENIFYQEKDNINRLNKSLLIDEFSGKLIN